MATAGKTFDRLTFSDKNPTINPVTGDVLRPTPFIGTGVGFTVNEGTPLPQLEFAASPMVSIRQIIVAKHISPSNSEALMIKDLVIMRMASCQMIQLVVSV